MSKIVNGPSKWDLGVSLLEGNPDHRHTVDFRIRTDGGMELTHTVAITVVGQENGSGESFNWEGYTRMGGPARRVRGHYSIKTRTGSMSFVEDIIEAPLFQAILVKLDKNSRPGTTRTRCGYCVTAPDLTLRDNFCSSCGGRPLWTRQAINVAISGDVIDYLTGDGPWTSAQVRDKAGMVRLKFQIVYYRRSDAT